MGVDNASKNSKYVKSFSKVYSRWESRSRCCGWILRFFFLPVRSRVKLFSVRSYSMSWCGAISPEVTTPLKNFIAFGLIWTTCASLFCTDWMVCPNKSVKRPFTVDLYLQSLLQDDMEAKFLDLNKPWSCKYGKQKNEHVWQLSCDCMIALRNKTIAHTILPSIDDANGFLRQERQNSDILLPW